MSWETKVLIVIEEQHKQNGELKAKWEITRPVNESEGKQFERGLQKTGYYAKNGEIQRGYPQPLTVADLNWISENWAKICTAILPPPDGKVKAQTEPVQQQGDIEEVPF